MRDAWRVPESEPDGVCRFRERDPGPWFGTSGPDTPPGNRASTPTPPASILLAMYKLDELKTRNDAPDEDHIVVLRGATWADFERVLQIRGDNAAPRVAYADGLLELMSPS